MQMKNNSDLNPTIGREATRQNSHARWKPILANLLVLAALWGSSGTVAFGQSIPDLFTEDILPSDSAVSAAEAKVLQKDMSAEQKDPTIIRSRYTKINLGALADNQIGLKLFNDAYTTIEKTRIEQRSRNNYTFYGKVEQVEDSEVLLVVEEGKLAGIIRMGTKLYQIRNVNEDFYTIREINQGALPHGKGIPAPQVLEQGDNRTFDDGRNTNSYGNIIDVMVLYTADAADANIDIDIRGAIDDANMAFSNSAVGWQLRLVHKAKITYSETGDMYLDLDRLTFRKGDKEDPSGMLDTAHTLRDTYGADLVVLITKSGFNAGGIGWVMNSLSDTGGSGFSITRRDLLFGGSHVFTQELTHNMGATHNPEDANVTPLFPYSYAHRYQDPNANDIQSFRTVTAYRCSFPSCPVRSYVSNPNVTYLGVPTGVVDQRDNARTLRQSLPVIAKWRPLKVAFTPKIISPTPGSTLNSTNVIFHGGTYGVKHWIQVGTGKGMKDIKNQYMGTSGVITVSGLPYTGKIYVRYWSEMPQGWDYHDYTYTMNVPDAPPKLITPVPGSSLFTTTATFTGAHASGDLQHWLYVGTAKGTSHVLSQNMGTNHSISVSGLPQSGTIYVRYWTRFASGWKFQDHTYAIRNFLWDNGGVGHFRN